MKKLLFLLIFFASQAWAESYSNQGIISDLTTENPSNFLSAIKPKITTRFIAETQFNDNYQSTNKQDNFNDLATKARLYNNLRLGKQVWLSSYAITERVNNNDSNNNGKNRYFDNSGAYLQELALHSSTEKYSLIAGKFNLNFGNAWRFDRGLWSYNLASNYKQTEKLGFSGVYRLGDIKKTGQYNFTFSTFTNDRKNLDNSLFANRNSAHKSDALPGDTRSLSSYNAGLNINFEFGKNEKLSYNFSYLNLAVNKRSTAVPASRIADQKGFVAGMNYQFPWKENIAFDFLLEYAGIKNFGGDSDIKNNYLTSNLITKLYKNWNVLLGYSSYRYSVLNQGKTDQELLEASFGYDFDKTEFFDRLTLQAGYKTAQINDYAYAQKQNSLGALLRYYKYF